MIPQIRKIFLLNETLNGKIELASLEGGMIIINNTEDKLIRCRVDKCKIISEVPLTVDYCHIDPLEDIEQTERIDKATPHAIIEDCHFNLCYMPKADYGNNYVLGKIQSSKPKANQDET